MRDQILHTHKNKGKIIVFNLYVYKLGVGGDQIFLVSDLTFHNTYRYLALMVLIEIASYKQR
jgi:hypothetical protein